MSVSYRWKQHRFKLLVGTMFMAAFIFIGTVASQTKSVSADDCSNQNGYITCHHGFFFGGTSNGVIDLMPGDPHAIPQYVDNAAEFTTFIRNQLGCNYASPGGVIPQNPIGRNSIGAAFIILTMMGVRPPVHPNRACAEYPTWEKRVFEWERSGDIEWNVPTGYQYNTAYAPNIGDAVFLGGANAGETPAIKFYSPTDPDRTPYSIRRACANPIGGMGTGFGVLATPPRGNMQPVSCTSGAVVRGQAFDDDIAPNSQGNPGILVDVWFYSPNENGGKAERRQDTVYPRTQGPGYEVPKPAWVDWATGPVEVTAYAYDVPGTMPNTKIGQSNFNACLLPATSCKPPATITPNPMRPRDEYAISASLTVANKATNTNRTDADAAKYVYDRSQGSMYITVGKPDGALIDAPIIKPPARTNNTITMSTQKMAPIGDTGEVNIYWGIRNGALGAATCPDGSKNGGGPGPGTPGNPDGGGQVVQVFNTPTFSAMGGDISAGYAMAPSGDGTTGRGAATLSCEPGKQAADANPNAGVVSWNNGAAGFAGAGTNYAIMALGVIQEVATGQGSGYAPNGLAFANATKSGGGVITSTYPAAGPGIYGGNLEGSGCTPNYFDNTNPIKGNYDVPVTPGKTDLIVSKDGAAGTTKESDTIYVDGNAYIKNNIIYANNTGYTNVAAIPRFTLVVRGNIYIAPDVTTINGVLVAQPKKGVTDSGIIYTCAPDGYNTNAATAPILTNQLGNTNRCGGKQLSIYGSVTARQIWLLRTYTGPTDKPQEQSERFFYTPEAWLNQPFTTDMSGKSENYDAVSSLPPIL